MALSYVTYTADGSTSNFAVPFGYLLKSHVAVTKNDVTAAFTWLTTSSIQLTVAPINGDVIRIARTTPKSSLVASNDGSVLTNSVLQTLSLQTIYLSEESQDIANDANAAAVAAVEHVDEVLEEIEVIQDDVTATSVEASAFADSSAASAVLAAQSVASVDAAFYPEAYNGVGNGIADDLAALNAAVTAANLTGIKAIRLRPDKTYRVSDTFVLPSGFSLDGQKALAGNPVGGAQIIGDDGLDVVLQVGTGGGNGTTSVSNVVVTRAGTSPATSTVGIHVFDGYNIRFLNVTSNNHGINWLFESHPTIECTSKWRRRSHSIA